MGLQFEETVYQHLHQEYGGHPFLVRQACSQLSRGVRDRPGSVTSPMYEGEKEKISVSLEKNIRQILNVLAIWYPQEYELLALLAQGDRATFADFARDSASFTEHVEGYGLVEDARSNPKLRIGLVRQHLVRTSQRGLQSEDKRADREDVLAEISRRRNRLEAALRTVLRDGLRFSHGIRAAQAALTGIREERRALLLQHSYEDMWPEMFFTDLIAIIESNWDDFSGSSG